MITVECTKDSYIGDGEFKKCGYKLIKPRWEHIVNTLYKSGGHAGKNTCPECKNNTLKFKFGEGD